MHTHVMLCVNVDSRAADWKLDTPDWSGRMRITARGNVAFIKLEDKVSGKTSRNARVSAPLTCFYPKRNQQ